MCRVYVNESSPDSSSSIARRSILMKDWSKSNAAGTVDWCLRTYVSLGMLEFGPCSIWPLFGSAQLACLIGGWLCHLISYASMSLRRRFNKLGLIRILPSMLHKIHHRSPMERFMLTISHLLLICTSHSHPSIVVGAINQLNSSLKSIGNERLNPANGKVYVIIKAVT